MKAIKVVGLHQAELQEVPVPRLRDDYLLCKVKCVALNPADWKFIDLVGLPGPTLGADFCGVVEEVGSKASDKWKRGDRVAGFVHGGNGSEHEDGAFGEYCVVKADIALKIPDFMSNEEAATLGVGVSTCGQALYQSLGLPLPGSGKLDTYLLVNGGSSATGALAVQYAILSGCKVVATASPHNWPILKDRGVEEVFDYNDPDCAKNIREYTNNNLTLVLDCIAEGNSAKVCEDSISSSRGGTICYLFTAHHTRKDVERKTTFGYTVFGESFEKFGKLWPASSKDLEQAKMFSELSSRLIAAGKIKPHKPEVGSGGLSGVFDGLQQLRQKRVSGRKLVYPIENLS